MSNKDDDEGLIYSTGTYQGDPSFSGSISITGNGISGGTITSNSSGGSIKWPVTGTGANSIFNTSIITGSPISVNKPAITIVNSNASCTKIRYVIIQQNGDMLELTEKKTITPREMIGICKFLNIVAACCSHGRMKVNWTELTKTLKIENHFEKPKVVISNSSNQSDVLEVQLHDSL